MVLSLSHFQGINDRPVLSQMGIAAKIVGIVWGQFSAIQLQPEVIIVGFPTILFSDGIPSGIFPGCSGKVNHQPTVFGDKPLGFPEQAIGLFRRRGIDRFVHQQSPFAKL